MFLEERALQMNSISRDRFSTWHQLSTGRTWGTFNSTLDRHGSSCTFRPLRCDSNLSIHSAKTELGNSDGVELTLVSSKMRPSTFDVLSKLWPPAGPNSRASNK